MSKRFGGNGGKGKKYRKKEERKFDPSPLAGDVDLSCQNVKLFLVKMPEQLAKHFEDSSSGIVGRMRFIDRKAQKPSSSNDIKPVIKKEEDNPFMPQPLDLTVEKLNKTPEGYIFIDKIATSTVPTSTLKPSSSSANGGASSSSALKATVGLGAGRKGGRIGNNNNISESDKLKLTSNKYELFSQPTNRDMVIFSGQSQGEKDDIRIDGIVESQYQARPVMDEAFRKLNKHRSHSMNTNSSKMQEISERDVRHADLRSLKLNSVNETVKDREEKKRKKEDSRRHLDVKGDEWRDSTKTAVFRAFEIQAYYTAEDLAKTIDEPVFRLRQFISELCQYNKSGPFTQRYELKDEFKTVAQRELKQRNLDEYRAKQLEVQRSRKEERDRDREREKAAENSKAKKAKLN